MADSGQQKLTRVRRPRIQITYEVETEGAMLLKELPFVVGVLGDFVGDQNDPEKVPLLSDRNFVEITGANFDDVMEKLAPKLTLTPADDDVPFPVELNFRSIDDFSPDNLVSVPDPESKADTEGIPELNALLQTRSDLSDLLTLVSRSHPLEQLLQDSLEGKDDALQKLKSALPAEEAKPALADQSANAGSDQASGGAQDEAEPDAGQSGNEPSPPAS